MKFRPAVEVRVTDHARERARERYPGFKAARIVDDVRAALCEGRCEPGGEEGLLHAWTPSGDRVYALRVKANALLVVTALMPGEKGEGEAA